MNQSIIKKIKISPQNPGIYIFKSEAGEFLYIGKAGNLKNRLKQYLNPVRGREGSQRASASNGVNKKTYSPFMEHLLNETENIETKTTASEVEALILESRMIKERRPKYNIMLRDGKQYFYVGFSNDKFPRIFITHQPWASGSCPSSPPWYSTAVSAPWGTPSRATPRLIAHSFIGPFTDGTALKATLRLLRRIFPHCTCKQKHNNFCLNYHIGNCPGFCCLKQPEAIFNLKFKFFNEYRKNIKTMKSILSGKKNSVIKNLKKGLVALGKKEEFEKAIELRNKIEKLEKVFANAKILNDMNNTNLHANVTNNLIELKKIFKLPKLPKRIEGYDISNIQGKNAVGAMAVFSNGRPDKNEYRKFKIRREQTPDDIAMLKEVLFRRFNHPEWPFPDLILIDGGIGQLNAAIFAIANIAAFSEYSKLKKPAIISLAKGKNEVFSSTLKKPAPLKNLPTETKNLILNIDAETHRFAISYYRKIHRTAIFR